MSIDVGNILNSDNGIINAASLSGEADNLTFNEALVHVVSNDPELALEAMVISDFSVNDMFSDQHRSINQAVCLDPSWGRRALEKASEFYGKAYVLSTGILTANDGTATWTVGLPSIDRALLAQSLLAENPEISLGELKWQLARYSSDISPDRVPKNSSALDTSHHNVELSLSFMDINICPFI